MFLNRIFRKRKWRKIEYFHPEGKWMPNGICYQRGYYAKQCRENETKFTVSGKACANGQCAIGLLIFPLSMDFDLPSGLKDAFSLGAMGHFFTGAFIDEYGNRYGAESQGLQLWARKSYGLLEIASQISCLAKTPCILKNLANNTIYQMLKPDKE